MKRKIIIISLFFLMIIPTIFCYKFYTIEKRYKEEGALLINQIENYKEKFGKSPNSVFDLNLKMGMGQGPYYKKVDSLNYNVYFTTGFDSYFLYDSKTKKWKDDP